MKIAKQQLEKIIKEELEKEMNLSYNTPSTPPEENSYNKDPDGYEGSMAKNNLYNLKDDAAMLCSLLHEDENLEPWVQEKIAVAASMINSVARYMKGEKIRPQE